MVALMFGLFRRYLDIRVKSISKCRQVFWVSHIWLKSSKKESTLDIALTTQADLGQRGTSNTRRDREASLDVEEFRANCLSPEYPDLGSTGLWLRRCFCGNELFWSRQKYLTMSLSKRCKMLGILLCEFGLDVVPKNRETLAAQFLKLPERRTCF